MCFVLQHSCFLFLTYCAFLCSSQRATSILLSMISLLSMPVHNCTVNRTQRISWLCCEFSVICSSTQLEKDLLPSIAKDCFQQHCQNCTNLPRKISRFAEECFWQFYLVSEVFFVIYSTIQYVILERSSHKQAVNQERWLWTSGPCCMTLP